MASKCSCKVRPERKNFNSSVLSFVAGIFIALLPKCPFCILAYSSAITLCSGKKLYHHDPTWASYISIFLAIFTLIVILMNYKGIKTILAALLVIIGSGFIIWSEMITGEITEYYWGVGFLLFGVWLNANLMYFYNKYIKVYLPKGLRTT